jgi:hypothetical protein
MKKTITTIAASAFLFSTTVFAQKAGQVKILFDCTHSESAGNGDWVIDSDLENLDWNPTAKTGTSSSYDHANPQQYPTPTQTAVTSSTAETYWQGALSYWAIDCVNKGYWVETLPPLTGKITYGVSTNAQDLSNYSIFVVDEPNILFTAAEKTAIMNFINNGGSLFAISDHTDSDRNNDGYDSPMIWNDFMTNNSVANNAFGYTFSLQNFSGTSSNVATSTKDSIIHGTYGSVAEVEWSNGTCMNINTTQNPSVQAHVWKSGITKGDTGVLCVTSRYGCGKIASIGDSSPPDDGTGNPAVTLYTGYTGDASGNHRPWLMNMMIWLAEPTNCKSGTTGINAIGENKDITIFPNPSNGILNINLENLEGNKEVKLYDLSGRLMMEQHTEANLVQLNILQIDNGSYLVKVKDGNGVFANKQVLLFK